MKHHVTNTIETWLQILPPKKQQFEQKSEAFPQHHRHIHTQSLSKFSHQNTRNLNTKNPKSITHTQHHHHQQKHQMIVKNKQKIQKGIQLTIQKTQSNCKK